MYKIQFLGIAGTWITLMTCGGSLQNAMRVAASNASNRFEPIRVIDNLGSVQGLF